MKKVDIDIIRYNVLAADKVIRDFKIPNLISRFYYGGTDSDFMGTIPGHNKKPAIITFDAVAVKLNSMKSAYKGLLVKHDCPSSTNWMDVLSHEIGHAVEWYLVRKKYPNSAKEQINSWKKCDVSTEIVINAIKRYRLENEIAKVATNGDLLAAISEYANNNMSEALVESVADVYNYIGNEPNKISILIVDEIKKYINKIGNA